MIKIFVSSVLRYIVYSLEIFVENCLPVKKKQIKRQYQLH